MSVLAWVLPLVVAALHLGFMVLESVLWTKPFGRRTFGLSREDAETTRVLASNQGVYNGMLAVGLIYGVLAAQPALVTFLLVFVVVVGIYGAATVSPTILGVQALPAAIALGASWLA